MDAQFIERLSGGQCPYLSAGNDPRYFACWTRNCRKHKQRRRQGANMCESVPQSFPLGITILSSSIKKKMEKKKKNKKKKKKKK